MLEARAFEPEFLRKLDNLVLGTRRARTRRAGQRLIGRHLGGSLEFENFREYSAGDDLRFLDWNTYARHDSLTVRTFRAERQVDLTVMIDASASMGAPAADDKLGLALTLGAALAFIGMNVNDPVRLAVFGGRRRGPALETTPFRRRRESYGDFRPFVDAVKPGGRAGIAEAVARLLHEPRPAGILVLISDFLVGGGDYEEGFERLLAAGYEVKAIHVMGERESAGDFPPGNYRVRDSESGELREVVFGPDAAAACRRRAAEHGRRLSAFCSRRGVLYAPAFGAARLDEIMAREFPRLGVIA